MNLILLEPHECAADGRVTLSGPRATHLRSVLGVAPGATVRVGMVNGATGTARVLTLEPDHIQLLATLDGGVPPRPRLDLMLALPRPKVLKRLWPQLAALGLGRIMLTSAVRVERHYFDTTVLAGDVYRPLLIEGLQQARDTRLPEVTVHRQLKVFVEDELGSDGPERRLFADPGHGTGVASVLAGCGDRRVLLAVGPEGGWTDYERRLLEAHAFSAVSMGPRILRSDTACVALVALVHEALRSSE